MLNNVFPIQNLRGMAKQKGKFHDSKTVDKRVAADAFSDGWVKAKENTSSYRVTRPKAHGQMLEDRVWTLFHKMRFQFLSGDRGGTLVLNPKDPESPKTQIDVIGIDDEVAIAVECKSSEKISKRSQFQDELGKHALIREKFVNAIHSQFPGDHKRQTVLVFFLNNIVLTDNDRARAKEANVIVFDEKDLKYYESLVGHLGVAAKYQLFSDMLPGKTVPGLKIRIPAIRSKMGGNYCYTFSISPEYLLKIAYVSHRSKGKASDVNTYQRMLTKARLTKIKEYIAEDGVFPTNIIVNLEKDSVRFERIHQESPTDFNTDLGLAGWLDIHPAYKSAWIIDGQHRLFAYSGHERASTSVLSVLAFEGLLPSKQAELFIDINAKQKSVKQSLLQELYAELHWDSDEPQVRIRAVISKAIQDLDANQDSALYMRVQMADSSKDNIRCISLTSIFSALEKTGFFIVKEKQGSVIEYGPLWGGENQKTLRRTTYVLKNWFNTIRDSSHEWWDRGSGEGGGLAMNDGVTTCINVLRSVFAHLDENGHKLVRLDDEDLFNSVKSYAEILGQYFGGLSEEGRKSFRNLRGTQGQTTRTRRAQQAIHLLIPSFEPNGLKDFLELEKAETNKKAKEIIDRIETSLQSVILEELKNEFGEEENQWWMLGVPKSVRLKVSQRFEEEGGKRGGKEYYFDLIDYRPIAEENWSLFEPILAFGKSGNKEKRTSWMSVLNEKRKVVSHASSAVTLTLEELSQLEEYDTWLADQIASRESVQE